MLFLDNIAHKETWMSIKRTIFLLHCCTGVVSSSDAEVIALQFGMILAVFCFHFGRVQQHTAPPPHTHTHTHTSLACSHHGGSRRLVKCYTGVPRKANRRTLRLRVGGWKQPLHLSSNTAPHTHTPAHLQHISWGFS